MPVATERTGAGRSRSREGQPQGDGTVAGVIESGLSQKNEQIEGTEENPVSKLDRRPLSGIAVARVGQRPADPAHERSVLVDFAKAVFSQKGAEEPFLLVGLAGRQHVRKSRQGS